LRVSDHAVYAADFTPPAALAWTAAPRRDRVLPSGRVAVPLPKSDAVARLNRQ
jgi:hypothetical protein